MDFITMDWFLIICFCFIFFLALSKKKIKIVPRNTTLIIDRNTHYYKTVQHGFYFFQSTTDFITTQISTNPTTVIYNTVFETHDGDFFQLTFEVLYQTKNIENVLEALRSSRRSIYDIINTTIDSIFYSFETKDIRQSLTLFEREVKNKLRSNFSSFYIDFLNYHTIRIISISRTMQPQPTRFKPHISSGRSPIQFS